MSWLSKIIEAISPLINYFAKRHRKSREVINEIYIDFCKIQKMIIDLRKEVAKTTMDNVNIKEAQYKCKDLFQKVNNEIEKIKQYSAENKLYLTKSKVKNIDKCISLTISSLNLLSLDAEKSKGLNRDTMEVTDELFKEIEKLKPKY